MTEPKILLVASTDVGNDGDTPQELVVLVDERRPDFIMLAPMPSYRADMYRQGELSTFQPDSQSFVELSVATLPASVETFRHMLEVLEPTLRCVVDGKVRTCR